jgi:hypothetical protein
MKHSMIFALVAATTFAAVGCASPTDATETESLVQEARTGSTKKIRADKKLVSALNGLSDVASGGPSLAFFGWKENPKVPATGCRAATAADAKVTFNKLVDTIMESGDPGEAPQLTPAVIADMKARFGALVGTGAYKICDASTGGFMSIGTITTIASTNAAGVKIALETGYED